MPACSELWHGFVPVQACIDCAGALQGTWRLRLIGAAEGGQRYRDVGAGGRVRRKQLRLRPAVPEQRARQQQRLGHAAARGRQDHVVAQALEAGQAQARHLRGALCQCLLAPRQPHAARLASMIVQTRWVSHCSA